MDSTAELVQTYLRRQYWDILKQTHFRDPAFEFLMTLEKTERGHPETPQ